MALGSTIGDVLIRIVGDEDDAVNALRKTEAELSAFGKIHATAEAELDTKEADLRLERLEQDLRNLDDKTVDPRIKVDTAGVLAELTFLRGILADLDANDVDIDVHYNRHIVDSLISRIASVTSNTNALTRAVSIQGDEQASFVSRLLDSAVHLGPFTTQLRTAIPLALGGASAITALVGAVGALVASLAQAVAGLGALAVAGFGALIPTAGLAAAAIARFQQQSDVAGTAAHALAQAFKEIGDVAKTLLPAADPALRAVASAVRALGPLLEEVRPAFMAFGRAAGDALSLIGDALRDPAIREGMAQLVRLSADVLAPLVRIGIAVGRILLNIARAAMPLLADGAKDAAKALEGIAESTENIGSLRGDIGGLVSQLSSWLNLTKELGRIFIGFVTAAAPAGQGLVDSLTEGARALADWVNSADGSERIAQFMADVLPLAEQIVAVVGKLIIAFLQVGQATAPIITPMVAAFSDFLDILNFVLNAINSIPAPIRGIAGAAALVINPFSKITLAIRLIIGAMFALGSAGATVFNAIRSAVATAAGAVRTAASAIRSGLSAAWAAVRGATAAAWGAVRGAVTGAVQAVRGAVSSAMSAVRGAVQSAWSAVRSATQSAWSAVRSAVSSGVQAIVGVVRGAVGALGGAASSAFQAVVRAATSGMSQVANAVRNGVSAAVGVVTGAAGQFFSAGAAWVSQLASGVASGANAVIDQMQDLAQKARDILPFSEPRDISSPLRNLDESGKALIRNMVAGIEAASGELPAALAKAASFDVHRLAARAATAAGGTGGGEMVQHFHVPPSPAAHGQPDARITMAHIALLSRQRRRLAR